MNKNPLPKIKNEFFSISNNFFSFWEIHGFDLILIFNSETRN